MVRTSTGRRRKPAEENTDDLEADAEALAARIAARRRTRDTDDS
ncbi:hypothetical protein ACNKF0_09265 [Nocardioides sp. T5]